MSYIYISWPFSFIIYLHKVGNTTSLFAMLSFYIGTILQICQSCRKLLLILRRDLWQIGLRDLLFYCSV